MIYLTLFLLMMVAMLARDAIWSLATSLIAKDKWLKAAVANSLGDGLGFLLVWLTAYIAVRSNTSQTIVQGIGEMAGAFAGVLGGKLLSLILDHKISWYTAKEIFIW